jgi:hypothetical protein
MLQTPLQKLAPYLTELGTLLATTTWSVLFNVCEGAAAGESFNECLTRPCNGQKVPARVLRRIRYQILAQFRKRHVQHCNDRSPVHLEGPGAMMLDVVGGMDTDTVVIVFGLARLD